MASTILLYSIFYVFVKRKVKIGVTPKIVDETVSSKIPIFTYVNSGVTNKIVDETVRKKIPELFKYLLNQIHQFFLKYFPV
jgi:hypothetical protein